MCDDLCVYTVVTTQLKNDNQALRMLPTFDTRKAKVRDDTISMRKVMWIMDSTRIVLWYLLFNPQLNGLNNVIWIIGYQLFILPKAFIS